MAQTFWTGSSLSFTNGSKTVTVNTGPNVDSIYPNSMLKAGSYNEPVEVKAAYGTTIELFENWPGSTGNTSATISPSAAAAAAAGTAAQQVVTEIQNLVGSASATATANSFVKRDSNGRIKSATPSANDDVVTKGYFQSDTALNAAGVYHSGNSVNPLDYGLKQAVSLEPTDNLDDLDHTRSGLYYNGTAGNTPNNNYPIPSAGSLLVIGRQQNNVTQTFISFSATESASSVQQYIRTRGPNGWTPWVETYHSGNSVNAHDHGIGRSTENPTWANSTLDDCSNIKTGVYRTSGSVTSPDQTAIVYFMRRNAGQLQQILVSSYDSSNTNTFQWRNSNGGTDAAPNWSDWKEVYHSGNTNFNEFGGNAANDVIAIGEAVNSTVARFYFPLQGVTPANSITLTGSINVLKGSASISTGITSTSVVLSGLTSSKIAVLDVSTTGLTSGDMLNLRTNTISTSIRFNF